MKKPGRQQQVVLSFVMLLLTLIFVPAAYAHGVVITYTLKANGEVELLAEFDTGEPITEAQVNIYSPEDPMNPWLTGVADTEGRYTFVIDPEVPGIWDIQFRKAGHGDIVHLQLEAGLIDPALMDHAPGALLPDIPAAETSPEAEEVAPAAKAEPESEAGNETPDNNDEQRDAETETNVGTASAVEPATETKETPAVATGHEPGAHPQAVAPVAVKVETTEKVARDTPKAAASGETTREVAVLSAGGNIAASGGFSTLQIVLMSASVIWGFVGTALYFSSKKTQEQLHTHDHHH